MSKRPHLFEEFPADYEAWQVSIDHELERQILEPPGGDRIIQDCLSAYRAELEAEPDVRTGFAALTGQVYTEYFDRKGEAMAPAVFWYLTRIFTVNQAAKQAPDYLGVLAEKPDEWRPLVHAILEPEGNLWHELSYTVSHMDQSTHDFRRGNSPLGFMALVRERFGPSVSVVDFGSSLNLMLKAMHYRYHLSGDPVAIMQPKTMRPDLAATTAFNKQILPAAPRLEWGWGVDRLDMDNDEEAIAFALSCSYPSEQLDVRLNGRRKAVLGAPKPSNIGFYRGDMTSRQDMDGLRATLEGRRADVAWFLFSSYQIRRHFIPEVLEMASEHVRPDGFIYLMGHLRAHPDNPGRVVHLSQWPPNGVHSLALDLADRERGWQRVFRSDGRFRRAWWGTGEIALEPGGEPQPIRSLVARYLAAPLAADLPEEYTVA